MTKEVVQSVDWLWNPYLPKSRISTLEAGDSPIRSLMWMSWAGIVTRRHGPALIVSPMSDATVRLEADQLSLNPDMTNMVQFGKEDAGHSQTRAETATGRLDRLALGLDGCRPTLVIIDQFPQWMPRGWPHSESSLWPQILGELKMLAGAYRCALLLVQPPVHSHGLEVTRAAASSIMGIYPSGPADPSVHFLHHVKSNLAPRAAARPFRFTEDEDGKLVARWVRPRDSANDPGFSPESTWKEAERLRREWDRMRRYVESFIRYQDGYCCQWCGTAGTWRNPLTTDHLVPVRLLGRNVPDNLRTLCRDCNSIKGVRTDE